jgi:eukaryotic-like serine/threonine-protein kinase
MPEGETARVAELFKAALDRDAAEWPTFLETECAGHSALRAEVESLLAHHRESDALLDQPAIASAAETFVASSLPPGERVQQYRIESLIGTGGMGEVYLATDTELKRHVALKLVQRGMSTQEIFRRFRQEEEILAGLNHPNIAQLYGTGLTPDGTPFFAMEYVPGDRLDEHCKQRALGVRERLQLFRKICSAVAYAHQHLVIHRDLKPANIRVTAEGEPKLLDFGIARILDAADQQAAELTMTLNRVMTPEYASPEQVRGEMMTTASDVYSLGVVLYELLTGTKPYRLTSRRPDEIARAIAEQQPERPSTATTGNQQREISNPKTLRGDLDNIVLMALRKEPARRYASVAQFSDDIRRYLEGRPVLARKDTFGYRASKFIHRNKVAVAAAVLVFLSLTGAVIVSMHQARRAERRFNDVRQLANSLMFEIHDSVQHLQGATPTRRLIVDRALQYLDSLSQESARDTSLQRELATAYEKVGDIQGNPYTPNLGDTDGALASYRKATAIREQLSKRDATTQARVELARSYRGLGDIMEQKGNIAECLKHYRDSLTILEQVAAADPADAMVQDELARGYDTLGDGLGRTGQNAERLRMYRDVLTIRSRLLAAAPDDRKQQRGTAIAFMKIASVPGVASSEAVENMTRATTMLQALADADPQNARTQRELGYASYQLGMILTNAGDHPGALRAREKALEIRQRVAADDPKNRQARFDLAVSKADVADTLTHLQDSARALPLAREALAIVRELTAADPRNAVYSRNLGLALERLGAALESSARDETAPIEQRRTTWEEARDAYAEALRVFTDLRDRGALMPTDADQIAKFTAKVADIERALSSL